jgi:hypothetical protein
VAKGALLIPLLFALCLIEGKLAYFLFVVADGVLLNAPELNSLSFQNAYETFCAVGLLSLCGALFLLK